MDALQMPDGACGGPQASKACIALLSGAAASAASAIADVITSFKCFDSLTCCHAVHPRLCIHTDHPVHPFPATCHIHPTCRYYAPRLAGKSLTKKLHAEVAAVFVERFGSRAGWAHSILFISELRQTQNQLQLAQAAEESG